MMKSTKQLARELGLLRKRHVSVSSPTCQGKRAKKSDQNFSYLIVIDFESTCWENDKSRPQEIIEFPAVLLNTGTGEIEDEFHYYLQPFEQPILSDFCKQLTGITQDSVDNGIPLPLCLRKFGSWLRKLKEKKGIVCVDEKSHGAAGTTVKLAALVTWSDWDLGVCMLYEARRKQITRPSALNCWIDLRATYRKFYSRRPEGLNGALKELGIQFDGREHSGVDDARNTARLAWRMICDGCAMTITKRLKMDKQGRIESVSTPSAYRVGMSRPIHSSGTKKKLHSFLISEDKLKPNNIFSTRSDKGSSKQPILSVRNMNVMDNCLNTKPTPNFKTSMEQTSKLVNTLTKLHSRSASAATSPNLSCPANMSFESTCSSSLSGKQSPKPNPSPLKKSDPSINTRNSPAKQLCSPKSNSASSHYLSHKIQTSINKAVCAEKTLLPYERISSKSVIYSLEKGSPAIPLHRNCETSIITSPTDNSLPHQSSSTSIASTSSAGSLTCLNGSSSFQTHSSNATGPFKVPLCKQSISKSHSTPRLPAMVSSCSSFSKGKFPTSGVLALPNSEPCLRSNGSTTPYLGDRTKEDSFKTPRTAMNSTMRATPPLCLCGRRSRRRQVQNCGPNMGRLFFSCSMSRPPSVSPGRKSGCGFFQWDVGTFNSDWQPVRKLGSRTPFTPRCNTLASGKS